MGSMMKTPWIVFSAVVIACGLGAGALWHAESTRTAALE